jgi:hypothetical protein
MRLGFVTELLSKPIRYGYMNGIALAVLVSQTSVKVEKGRAVAGIWSIAVEIAGGRMNWTEFALGGRYARGDLLDQDLQGPAWHPSRGRRRDGNRTGF